MHKFQVGDRVRLKQIPTGIAFADVSGTGTVQEITARGYNVVFDSHTIVRRLTNEDLELAESQPEPHDHS